MNTVVYNDFYIGHEKETALVLSYIVNNTFEHKMKIWKGHLDELNQSGVIAENSHFNPDSQFAEGRQSSDWKSLCKELKSLKRPELEHITKRSLNEMIDFIKQAQSANAPLTIQFE